MTFREMESTKMRQLLLIASTLALPLMLPCFIAVWLGAEGSAEKMLKLVVVLSELSKTQDRASRGTNLLV